MKNQFLLLAVLLSFSFIATAQPPCGFDDIHQKLLATDPAYARQISETNTKIRQFIESHPQLRNPSSRVMATYTIPVVVHVLHTGGPVGSTYNPTDAQITGAISYLNAVYAGTYAGMTAPSAGGAAGNTDIQFALAQRTPTCGATNGIDRIDASSIPNYSNFGVNRSTSSGASDLTIKDFARWNPANYYNIWVVNKIDGADGTSGQFVAGYAYFAGAPSNLDGTVMLATQMVTGAKTLPHEIGHALNLYHTFEGSNNDTQCPPYTSSPACYSDGDQVCDTDPITNNYNVGTGLYNFNCRLTTVDNGCTSLPTKKYSINTENNFMSYTNCYTLFTNDQKARMQAAMSLSGRASLISGANMALIPCGTVINFSQVAASLTESITGTTAGCRTYTDYTYQMVVGASISATSTATLTYTGTAVKGLDYDVTTNGNFTTPSNILTFNASSTATQSFTVRVYNDANVETAESIIIDFTLNNGGGNAAKGSSAPTLTITLSDNDIAPAGAASGTTAQIGSSAGSLSALPFDAKQQSMRSQYLYRASELSAAGVTAGNITALQLYISSKVSTRPFTNFTIKMAHTGLNYLVNGSYTVVTGMAPVYSGTVTTAANWNNFTFSSPFVWDGINNVAIEICYDNVTADAANAADAILVYADGGTGLGNMFYGNGVNCAGSLGSVAYYPYKPLIKFSYAVTGTAVETAATSTASTYIAAGSNDYLYSNNSKLLMRLGSVSASLGCTSSTLDAGGTSWVSYLGGQRSAKVFLVTPTTNIATTTYTIALYFDNTELGGKSAASLRLVKTSAASAAAATQANSVIVVPTVTTLGSGTTVFTASFTGFSRFFLIDASVGLITLPIELTDFTARVNIEKNTVLNWITASEQNNRRFDVEVSRNGTDFALLGTVASKGNSTTIQRYDYLHIKPAAGITWYRLKQTDWDERSVYSKVVYINIDKGTVKPFVYPVPAKDVITVNFGKMIDKGELTVFSADMKTLKREGIREMSVSQDINISGLPAGVYFIRLTADGANETMRFIKK